MRVEIMYGSECLTVNRKTEQKMSVAEMKMREKISIQEVIFEWFQQLRNERKYIEMAWACFNEEKRHIR